MKIVEIDERGEVLVAELTHVWESSVKATHLFLSDDEIAAIKREVPAALRHVTHLMVAKDDYGNAIGFMSVEDSRVEMLFISASERRKGVGRKLIEYAAQRYSINSVTVNAQNPQAVGFYLHLGFKVYDRSALDEQGRPYPLLYMKL